MRASIKLEYGRAGETYHGSYQVKNREDGEGLLLVESIDPFSGYTFARMMSVLARHIRECSEVDVVLARHEAKGSEYKLDADTVELLRADPAAAISSMTHEDRTVMVRDRKSSRPPLGLLRAGHDTVAAAFGDELYVSVNDLGRFECPGCGRWSPVMTHVSAACDNNVCRLKIAGRTHGTTWFSTSTESLLNKGLSRYCLPRPWNPSGWIRREDLRAMFEAYKKERDQCNQANAPRA
jgi:hypothetical protein